MNLNAQQQIGDAMATAGFTGNRYGTSAMNAAPLDESGFSARSACRLEMRGKTRRRRENFHQTNRCVKCGKWRDIAFGRHCSDCKFSLAAHRWLGDSSRGPELRRLLEAQNYRCAYTGWLLEIGKDASVDHVLPRARGGGNEIENLHWVSLKVNRMKSAMTHEEFIETCKAVAYGPAGLASPPAASGGADPWAPALAGGLA